MYLTGIRTRSLGEGFPWTLPVVRSLDEIRLGRPVTFLVGENGSGKSTLLEAIAVGMKAVAMGARDLARDETLGPARALARTLTFARKRHARTRLFLRAEDMFGFTRRVATESGELAELREAFREELPEGSWGQQRAMGIAERERRLLQERYGEDPHARSHGETFLELLGSRLTPGGFYMLDEPETPLSPNRVLALMALLRDRLRSDCQFVIATHSPILMALPEAEILAIEDGRLQPMPYDAVEHVRVTRDFLASPERFLRHL